MSASSTLSPQGDPNSAVSYPSPPLDAIRGQIRLLKLLPALQLGNDIQCQLETISLDAKPEFEALSYTWGWATEGHSISIYGQTFAVTDNLFYALRRLRCRDRVRTLWVDALCINQNDIDERNAQVTLMARLYGVASRVLVWLGESEFMSKSGDEESTAPSSLFTHLTNDQRLTWHLCEAMSKTRPSWWERVWVVQEMAKARDVVVHFGPCTSTWYDVVEVLPPDPSTSFIRDLSESLIQGFKESYLAFDTIRYGAQSGRRDSLFLLSSTLWKTQATVPHDKVYSLLGLMEPSEAELIVVDYGTSFIEAFANATSAAIMSAKSLDILSAVKLNPAADSNRSMSKEYEQDLARSAVRDPEQPSWCINFLDFKRTYSDYLPLFESYSSFQGTPPTEQMTFEEDRRLLVGGREIDAITAVLDDMDSHQSGWYRGEDEEQVKPKDIGKLPSSDEQRESQNTYGRVNTLLLSAIESAETLDPYAKFAESHTTRRRPESKTRLKDDWTHEFSFVNAFEVWQSCIGYEGDGIQDDGQAVDQWQMQHIKIETEIVFYSRYVAGSVSLFATATGHIGAVPGGVMVGDKIAYLDGAKLPVVLRPRPGNDQGFTFHGFAYVHGMMELDLTSDTADVFVLKHVCDREDYKRNQFVLY